MYQLSPPVICVFEHALEDERSATRIDAMLCAVGCELSSVERVTEADIPDMIARHGWGDARLRQGALGAHTQPALVFTRHRGKDAPEVAPVLEQCPPGTDSRLVGNLLGRGGTQLADDRGGMGLVCRPRVQFDTLCFEPEYGLSALLAEYYASTRDQHYLIHTKSANVDSLLDLDHRGHTIALWSLTSETASRLVEPGSATMEERVEAARTCQEAGYPIRYKFKPIVPVRGWLEYVGAPVGIA